MKKASFYVILGILIYISLATTAAGKCKPPKGLDVVFVIDNSKSIPPKDFEEVKKFAVGMIDEMVKAKTDLKIGLIEFSGKAVPSLWLSDELNKERKTSAIRKKFLSIKQPDDNFNTNTHLALFIARTQMLNVKYEEGARCNCAKILILITDGAPSWPTFAYTEALAVMKQGIHLFVVGTGAEANFPSGNSGSKKLLSQYFTGGDESKVFRADEYKKLPGITSQVVEATCKVVRSLEKKVAGKINTLQTGEYEKLHKEEEERAKTPKKN
ncbi:collagen alpha-1(XX) chain-like [Lineus longissimus]|uniref:collagen alpha-1(XX) chain-like n=1 Tax=Lineus longissimus TaxID=88925 RepID=UPI002B4E16A9